MRKELAQTKRDFGAQLRASTRQILKLSDLSGGSASQGAPPQDLASVLDVAPSAANDEALKHLTAELESLKVTSAAATESLASAAAAEQSLRHELADLKKHLGSLESFIQTLESNVCSECNGRMIALWGDHVSGVGQDPLGE